MEQKKKSKRKIPEVLTESEFIKIYKVTKHRHHKLAFALGFYECMRVSEIVNLTHNDIDRGQKLIRIRNAKGMKDRNIPIAKELWTGLKYLPVNCGIRALQIAFKLAAVKAGITKGVHFHSLRHSGATFYLNVRNWSVRQVQVMLGHSKITTTEIYTHVSPMDLVNKMGWDEE